MGAPNIVALVNFCNQAMSLKFRLLSVAFTSARSDDKCNRDISPSIVVFVIDFHSRVDLSGLFLLRSRPRLTPPFPASTDHSASSLARRSNAGSDRYTDSLGPRLVRMPWPPLSTLQPPHIRLTSCRMHWRNWGSL